MNDSLSRRDFLKMAAFGAAGSAILTGCGPASRYVTRQPYLNMPEYNVTGQDLYFATTCGECSAGCGLVVRTMEGRAHKVDGNSKHPVNHGGTCSRGQATLQGLYNPDRIQDPGAQAKRASGDFLKTDWEKAVAAVAAALKDTPPTQVAFLLGLFPDHLHDLVQKIAAGLGGATVVRYGALSEFEARQTLALAAQNLYGQAKIPAFDLSRAELLFSFGANFVETWISPVSYAFAYGKMRQGFTGQRGYLVQFEPRMSQTAANADEWYPIKPGSEQILALALARLVSEAKNGSPQAAFKDVDVAFASAQSGVSEKDLRRLGQLFADSPRALAVPGGFVCGGSNGLANAEALMMLNLLAGNTGQPGGVSFLPTLPIEDAVPDGSLADVNRLIAQMKANQIKVLFIHGANPMYELPQASGFAEALKAVPQVISFASFLDETAIQADLVLPDHTPLESWGYQRVRTASDRSVLSGIQPVVSPLYNTKATADVLLGAVAQLGGSLASAVPFSDEVAFIQHNVADLANKDGLYSAPTFEAFWTLWQQSGGWWQKEPDAVAPQSPVNFDHPITQNPAQYLGDPNQFPYYLMPYPAPNLGDGSAANRPVLQESPDPMTTVMWNSWVEINTQTAGKLGLKTNDLVNITTPIGSVQAVVYVYPAIHPEVIAMPLGQGHTTFGRYASGRGFNPLTILSPALNEAGNLAFMSTRAQIVPLIGKTYPLARYESEEGVYHNQNFVGGQL